MDDEVWLLPVMGHNSSINTEGCGNGCGLT